MKKILGFMAVAALMIVGCGKDPNGSGSNYKNPLLSAPYNQKDHFHFIVDDADPQTGMQNPDGQQDKIKGVTFPPGSSGVAEFETAGPKPFDFSVEEPSKAAKLTIVSGTVFTVKKGLNVIKKFIISLGKPLKSGGEGEGATLTVFVGDKAVTLLGTIVAEPEYTPYRQDVCRNWTIEETIVAVRGEDIPADLGVGKKFQKCDLSEISNYLVEKGVKIKALGQDYNVNKIMIDPSGKFGIFFQGKDPYYGDYTLKGTEFEYKFTYFEEDNPILAGTAKGKLTATNGYGRLQVKSDMKDNSGKAYSVDLIFKLKSDKAPAN